MAYIGQEPGQGQAERFIFTASGGETAVSADDSGLSLGYTENQVSVYLNGVKLVVGTDCVATNGSTITGLSALTASDVVEVIALSSFSPADTVPKTGGTFTGAVTASAGVVGNLTGNASGTAATVTTAAQPAITSVGTLTSFRSTGIDDNADALAITIDSSENVGIGTTSITTGGKLEVSSSDSTTYTGNQSDVNGLIIRNDDTTNNNYSGVHFFGQDGNSSELFGSIGVIMSDHGSAAGDGSIFFQTMNNNTNQESMRIKYDGNVGIGTDDPQEGLHVNVGGVVQARLQTTTANTGSAIDLWTDGGNSTQRNWRLQNNHAVAGTFAFLVGTSAGAVPSVARMAIAENGNVGIGTTAPTALCHVYGAVGGGGSYAAIIHNTTNSNGNHALMTNLNSNQHNTSNQHIRFHTGGVANYYIYGNGTHSLASDERLKKNIETTRDGYLEDLCKFRVVKYNWFNDDDTTPKDLGLIAQEVEQIFPNLVQDDQATISDDDDTLYKQLKITVLPFMLLKAIQELSAKNDALEARILTLESA